MSLRIAVVCSSNQNRSMEAHAILSKKGFNVKSFGTGANVKLPGSAPDKPNIYDFSTTYEQMYQDLCKKDKHLEIIRYTQNGILHMLDRNRRIKSKPERFQDCKDDFDIVITVEERVYDQVVEGHYVNLLARGDLSSSVVIFSTDLEKRGQTSMSSVHVINMEVKDNHDEATLGAFLICELCQMLQGTDDLENDIDELIQDFEAKADRDVLHTVAFY
ncbi:RNA polymerase II subunit A C-terminal domain phosphatase SSU72 [Holothuria leucospilota]|uniref:RNA polymerase II subunit A C-terminal domain phosphatase SSU72 n=1 Tax=Holothuria leucospilota TaxID=206669 RepID=A0A9Q0YIW0_HOLLE|nr:RNA polymerase II subunit A C-terminal domain phosphatase SSU72 [Holothuria leucospilota]